MFRELCTEINNQLGAGFHIYYNEDVSDNKDLEAKDKTIGVFRVTSGSIQPLQGDRGVLATIQLDLFAKIEDKSEVDKVDNALDLLIANRNGKLYVQTISVTEGEVQTEQAVYSYVCNYQVPRVLGNTVIGPDSDRCILKQLIFTVVMTSTLTFGDEGVCYLSETELTELNKAAAIIPGVLRWTPMIESNTVDNTEINKPQAESIPVSAGRKCAITGLASSDEAFVSLMTNAFASPEKIYYFRLEFAGAVIAFRAIVDRFLVTGVKSDFVSYELALAPVPEWL